MDDGEANLAKDSLVALDTLVMDHRRPTQEVCSLIWKHIAELMETEAFVSHSSVPGRMAIISMMTKLCAIYKEEITDGLFLYLMNLMKRTGDEILKPLDSGEGQVEDLAKLLSLSVKLLCFCVTHGKNTAQSVLSKNAEARATLEKLLDEQDSGILDESRLEIMDVLDQIDELSSQTPNVIGGVAKLVKMLNSSAPACRPQLASRILKSVKEQQDEEDITEMKKAGVINALMVRYCSQYSLMTGGMLSLSQMPFPLELNFFCLFT